MGGCRHVGYVRQAATRPCLVVPLPVVVYFFCFVWPSGRPSLHSPAVSVFISLPVKEIEAKARDDGLVMPDPVLRDESKLLSTNSVFKVRNGSAAMLPHLVWVMLAVRNAVASMLTPPPLLTSQRCSDYGAPSFLAAHARLANGLFDVRQRHQPQHPLSASSRGAGTDCARRSRHAASRESMTVVYESRPRSTHRTDPGILLFSRSLVPM